jgi:hypothetical protein
MWRFKIDYNRFIVGGFNLSYVLQLRAIKTVDGRIAGSFDAVNHIVSHHWLPIVPVSIGAQGEGDGAAVRSDQPLFG